MSARPQGMGLHQRGGRRVSSESELAATIEDFGMPILVQRCLRGPVHSSAVWSQTRGSSRPPIAATCAPGPRRGERFLLGPLPLPAQLREAAATLLDRLGFRGIFELELMEKPDGNLGLIDLNPGCTDRSSWRCTQGHRCRRSGAIRCWRTRSSRRSAMHERVSGTSGRMLTSDTRCVGSAPAG